MLILIKLLVKYVIIIYALESLQETFGVESKPFQSRSTVEIPGRASREERLSGSKLKWAFLIDSGAGTFHVKIVSQNNEIFSCKKPQDF